MQRFLLFGVFIIWGMLLNSQPLLQRSIHPDYFILEKYIYQPGKGFHTSVRPYLSEEITRAAGADSLLGLKVIASPYETGTRKWLWNKLFNEDLITIKNGDYKFIVNPLINFELSNDFKNDDRAWVNTRGFMVEGNIGPRFAFATRFYENQATFVDYIDEEIQRTQVIPGQGSYKGYKQDGYDFSRAEGYISYSPSEYFNFRFGHGRNFWGDGYRSLLLGDAHFPYPYFMINTTVWRIRYVNLYAEFMDKTYPRHGDQLYRKKYGTFHYLTLNLTSRLKVGLFEAIIWKASDSTGFRGFDFNYLNPVIFYRPVEFSLGSPDNALMGANASYTLGANTTFYGQLLLDELKVKEVFSGKQWWGNKQAVQLGVKTFDFLGIKNLRLQLEYNYIRPYTYSYRESIQNYGHYNQPLAHPMGANLREVVGFMGYHLNRWFLNYQLQFVKYGADTNGINFGKDIFRSYEDRPLDYGVKTGQGLSTQLWRHEFKVSWMINPNYNLVLSSGFVWRKLTNARETQNLMLGYVSLSTALEKLYYDF
ncbi:MAG: hypothetical protein ACP5O2_11450 [Bacteroidales bacterium]